MGTVFNGSAENCNNDLPTIKEVWYRATEGGPGTRGLAWGQYALQHGVSTTEKYTSCIRSRVPSAFCSWRRLYGIISTSLNSLEVCGAEV